jgi:hypothetical protein
LRCQTAELPLFDRICRQWKIEPGGIFEEPAKSETPPDLPFIEDE